MNCKLGDMALIKTTHPYQHLHGKLVECLSFEGNARSSLGIEERDCWNIRFLGAPQLCDDGIPVQEGWIPDRYLTPIAPERGSAQLVKRDEHESFIGGMLRVWEAVKRG